MSLNISQIEAAFAETEAFLNSSDGKELEQEGKDFLVAGLSVFKKGLSYVKEHLATKALATPPAAATASEK